ncbi:MAG: ATP-binding protein [Thermodesulfobacteriota bacterium]
MSDQTIIPKYFPLPLNRLGVGNKILLMVLLIFICYAILLSLVVGATSFNNLSLVTNNNLKRMASLLAARIVKINSQSIQVVQSMETNYIIVQQLQRLTSYSPYYSTDASLLGRAIEDSEVIYAFQAQMEISKQLLSLQTVNALNSIRIFLVSPFNMVPDASPALTIHLDREALVVTRFHHKGRTAPPRFYRIALEKLVFPGPDYFDISSVYALPPEKFYEDNRFTAVDNVPESILRTDSWSPHDPPRSKIILKEGLPVIRTWFPVSVLVSNPETFMDQTAPCALVVVEKILDAEVMKSLKNDLGVDVGLAWKNRLLIASTNLIEGRRPLSGEKNLVLEGKDYYYCAEPVRLMEEDRPDLQVVTMSPISELTGLTRTLFFQIGMVTGFAVLVTVLLIYIGIHRVVKIPLQSLMNGVRSIAEGDMTYKVHIHSPDDELGALSSAFNQMSAEIGRKSIELEDVNRHLRTSVVDLRAKESDLNKTKNYLNNIINSMPSMLVGVDQGGNVTEWNVEAERATGIPAGQAKGKHLNVVYPGLITQLEEVYKTMREKKPYKAEKLMSWVEGETHYSDVMVYPLITNGVEGAVLRIDDVTNRVRIEEMMIQTEKMISVGGLAAGMAHEINNPIGGILQSVQNINRRVSTDFQKNVQAARECGTELQFIRMYLEKREIFSFLEGIRDAGQRAANIIANMLNFSRQSHSQFMPTRLDALLDNTLALAAHDYDLKKRYDFRHIRIIREFSSNLPEVPCIPTEIEQVILNLLKNAAQAMMEKDDPRKEPQIILRLRLEGKSAVIEVEDNGPGMDENIRKRVFEPFFTTKEVGVGTGLGLSVAYFIINNNHRGTMTVTSTPSIGTKFSITLPVNGSSS